MGPWGSGSPPDQKAREFRTCKAFKIQDVAKPLQYCSLKLAATKSPTKIIYFLHGAGGGARDVYDPLVESFVQNMPEAAVVGISYGPEETIPLKVGQPPTSLKALIYPAMPDIESELGIVQSSDLERDLVGMSLGGFNALNLASRESGWFQKVAVLCPALIGFDPFNDSEVQAYIQSNPKIQANLVIDLIGKLRQKFVTPENWRIRDPIFLARNGYYNGLSIFLSTGSDDEFGFFQGA